jgi:hypothetical protein
MDDVVELINRLKRGFYCTSTAKSPNLIDGQLHQPQMSYLRFGRSL